MSKLRRKFTKEQKLEIVIMSLEDNQSVIEELDQHFGHIRTEYRKFADNKVNNPLKNREN